MDVELWKIKKKELKLTNAKISNSSGIPLRTVEAIFAGKTQFPRSDTVDAIEKVLGIKNEQKDISPKTKEIVELLMQLDDSQLNDALAVIKIIAKK